MQGDKQSWNQWGKQIMRIIVAFCTELYNKKQQEMPKEKLKVRSSVTLRALSEYSHQRPL